MLIRGRWQSEPGFLGEAGLAAWGLLDIGEDNWPASKLLDRAASALGLLNTQFLPRCGSGGVRETDETTPEGRLVSAIAGLAEVGNRGGPHHNGALLEAARLLREGKDVEWASLVAWDSLGAIRADLDELPTPEANLTAIRLDRIETALDVLVERQTLKDWYSTSEIAKLLGKAEYTVREHCRQGRIRAEKKGSGRGRYQSWVVSQAELQRVQKEGLLSVPSGG